LKCAACTSHDIVAVVALVVAAVVDAAAVAAAAVVVACVCLALPTCSAHLEFAIFAHFNHACLA